MNNVIMRLKGVNLIPLLSVDVIEDLGQFFPIDTLLKETSNEYQQHLKTLRQDAKKGKRWQKAMLNVRGLSMTVGFSRLEAFTKRVIDSDETDFEHDRIVDELERLITRTLYEAQCLDQEHSFATHYGGSRRETIAI